MSANDTTRIDVVILAGGRGTRLQSVVTDVPKPLAPVNGRPFIEYQLALLQRSLLVGRVVLAIGHLADRVIDHFAAHKPVLDLSFAVETQALGTAGALRNALPQTTTQQIFVLNGDSIFRWDLAGLSAVHRRWGAKGTLSLLEVDDVSRYGSVAIADECVVSFKEKSELSCRGLINAGAYLFDRSVVAQIAENELVSLERDVLPALARKGALASLTCESDFIDIGLPETYRRASSFLPRFFE